jgi:hypothetical protein
MDNGPAAKDNFARRIQESAELVGDMIEVSTLRREDFDMIRSKRNMYITHPHRTRNEMGLMHFVTCKCL